MQNKPKINQLQQLLPEGLVVSARWLEAKGYSSALRNRYVRSGWLEQLANGVYRRPGGKLLWQHIVISLQCLLEYPVIVGGRSALELQGFAHYVAKEGVREIHLYSDVPLPTWLKKISLDVEFIQHKRQKLFRNSPITIALNSVNFNMQDQSIKNNDPLRNSMQGGFVVSQWGQWNWPITLSSPERAILELLDEIPKHETFDQADVFMASLRTLSPRRLQKLLEDCHNVKVKRLFLWFAQRHQLPWLKQIKQETIDLGSGKRMLVRGGKLDPHYLITVPENLDGAE